MAHIEISLAPAEFSDGEHSPRGSAGAPLESGWLDAIRAAEEPCLLLDAEGTILGISAACATLLGASSTTVLLGRGLLDDLVDLVDFTPSPARLLESQVERIPPLLALASGGLARGLMRVRCGTVVQTLDAVATPLWSHERLVGSLTFFHRI